MTMYNFTSKTLNRTFDAIVFSPGLEPAAGQPAAAAKTTAEAGKDAAGFSEALQAEAESAGRGTQDRRRCHVQGSSTGSAGAIVPSAEVNVTRPPGANSHSVGECFEQGQGTQLQDRPRPGQDDEDLAHDHGQELAAHPGRHRQPVEKPA